MNEDSIMSRLQGIWVIPAGIDEPLWLYALNARTEITMLHNPQECTAIVLPKRGILGQNWDWTQTVKR